jgi:hypothetical protein
MVRAPRAASRPRGLSRCWLWPRSARVAPRGEEICYLTIFGSQSQPKQLRYCHTWATFVRGVGSGSSADNYETFSHTISWYPASRAVRVWSPLPETGVNMGLHETLETVSSHGERLLALGPYAITPQLFNRSIEMHIRLLTGEARYRAIDTAANLLVCDCIHAVAAVDPGFGRRHYPLIRVGLPASRYIAHEVWERSPLALRAESTRDHSWLFTRLGLDRHAIAVVPPGFTDRQTGALAAARRKARRR